MATVVAMCVASTACQTELAPRTRPNLPAECQLASSMRGENVPSCLFIEGAISGSARASADSIIARAQAEAATYRQDTSTYERASMIDRSLQHVADFYARGLLTDTARFNRIIDHVEVTAEFEAGHIPVINNRLYPARTPHISWRLVQGVGVYPQPVETVQAHIWIRPDGTEPIDTLLAVGDALWKYAVWHTTASGLKFPRYEYDFPIVQYGVELRPPWQSGMAQGEALIVFSELARRLGSRVWRERADAVFQSFRATWDEGGVQIADTSGGLWWEEYHPAVRVWNGSMVALIAIGEYANLTNDPAPLQMYRRGLARAERETPRYDTGTWTRYALIGPTNGRFYHSFHIQIADALYAQSGQAWAKTWADRWRSYPIPPGTRP